MRPIHRRFAAVAMLVGTAVGVLGRPAGAAPSINDCSTQLGGGQSGSLALSSTTTGAVAPGANINLSATWTTPAWAEKATLLVCTTMNGAWDSALSGSVPVVAQDGSYDAPLTVPTDATSGSTVCIRDILVGHQSDGTAATQTSNELCFRTAAVIPPTTTTTSTTQAPAAATTTTTEAAPVSGTTAGASTPPGRPAPLVLPSVASRPVSSPQLPRTGSPVEALAVLGVGTTGLGGLMRRAGTRRR